MTDTPRLHTNSQTISLSFESTLIQSCMRLDAPSELVLDYTRTMLGFVRFNPRPPAVLMSGLGGGSMLKYLHAHLPDADLTTIVISQAVIDMRHENRFYVAEDAGSADLISGGRLQPRINRGSPEQGD